MVAYSYVFVSATPKFTCSVAREIQLISYDESSSKLLNKLIIDQDSDNPFEKIKSERSEFFIETRRFIRLLSKNQTKINFDNNCKIDPSTIRSKSDIIPQGVKTPQASTSPTFIPMQGKKSLNQATNALSGSTTTRYTGVQLQLIGI